MKKLIDVNMDKLVYLRIGKYSLSDLFIISQNNNILFEIVLCAVSANMKAVWVDTTTQNMVFLHTPTGTCINGDKYKLSIQNIRTLVAMKPLTLQKIDPTMEVLERYLYFMDNYKDYITTDIENFEEKFRNKNFDSLINKIRKDIKKPTFFKFNEFKVDEKDICLN